MLCLLFNAMLVDGYTPDDFFDRVYYGTWFSVLLTKCVSMCFIRLILDSYIRQKACALWNNVKSRYFTMANGVKQEGVTSSFFLVCI